ncbi:hypothetical protein OSTOST_12724, partial [Ostertagia ostertagi]
MLRRLKAQVSQVANDLPGVLSPGGGRDSRDGTPFFPNSDSTSQNDDDEIEGFLCPICMSTFNSPELLSGHFEEAHNKENSLIPNPNFENSLPPLSPGTNSTASFPTKDKEIEIERHCVLQEELDRIQSVVAQATDVPQGEVPYLMQQNSVTQRMLEFEKENGQLKRFAENGQQERAEIMAKLKQLSGQIRTLTDENEGNKVEKEVLKKELAEYRSDKEKMEKEMDILNKALDQRPSEDDVAVLRTELVHAQKLMDEISQQKDVEISEHLNSIRMLNMEREKQRCVMENLQKQLDDTGSHSKESSEIIRSLTSELEDTRQLLITCQKDLEDAKSDSSQKGKRVEELHGKVEANLAELASCREKIAQLEETVRVSAREIDDSHAMNESNLKKLTQLSDKLEQVIEEKNATKQKCPNSRRKTMCSRTASELELSNMDLTNELSSLGSLLEHERQTRLSLPKDQELFSLREELERAHIETEKLKSQNESRAAESESLAKQLLGLAGNTKELMDRKDSLLAKANEQEKLFREERKSAADKLKKVEHQKETLERRLREAEDDVNRKAERFVEMEKEIEDDRRTANERINKLKEIVRLKEASVLEAR